MRVTIVHTRERWSCLELSSAWVSRTGAFGVRVRTETSRRLRRWNDDAEKSEMRESLPRKVNADEWRVGGRTLCDATVRRRLK